MSVDSTAYGRLEVPCDLVVELVSVETYDNRSKGGSHGWLWKFETKGNPNGEADGLGFRVWTSLSEKARWKLEETLAALGDTDLGEESFHQPPVHLIRQKAYAHIDYPSDYYRAKEDGMEYEKRLYRNIEKLTPLPTG